MGWGAKSVTRLAQGWVILPRRFSDASMAEVRGYVDRMTSGREYWMSRWIFRHPMTEHSPL